jgi:hypothetical protein
MISNLTTEEFKQRTLRFRPTYVEDWQSWLETTQDEKPEKFGEILRRWQACRPNKMRQTRAANLHEAPFLEDIIDSAATPLKELDKFDISNLSSYAIKNHEQFDQLWRVFENLPYSGNAKNGKASIVGISKSALLLSKGRLGPAFDSKVQGHLQLGDITNAKQWFNALKVVTKDIIAFQDKNSISIRDAAPEEFKHLSAGRLYDMALGPGD